MPVLLQDIDFEGNPCKITQTTPIDILVNPGTFEHVHVGQNCSTKETKKYRAYSNSSEMFFLRRMKKCL